MKKINNTTKIFAILSVIAGAIWLGSYLTRMLATYSLFEENSFILKSGIGLENVGLILNTILPSVVVTFSTYIILIIFFTLFLISSKMSLKINGWLFIITLIIYITMPFEIYLMIIDWQLISANYFGEANTSKLLKLIVERFENLSGFPIIILISYITLPYFFIQQPLTKVFNNEN